MSEMMNFPDTWEEYEKLYGFNDSEEIYTNNSRLIPSFRVKQWLDHLPSAQPRKKGKWTTEEVAEILFNAFGDDCACNFNGIDEWLPERCKYTEIADECPEPKEKHGCWMQFLLQGGAVMRGDSE